METPKCDKVYFVNTGDAPVKTVHICYFVKSNGLMYELFEVVEEYFPHPDAPNDALIFTVEVYKRDERQVGQTGSGPLIQGWAMEDTLKLMYPVRGVSR